MNKKISAIVISFFALLVFAFVFSSSKEKAKPQPNQIITEPKIILPPTQVELEVQEVAYKLGFEKGQTAFFKQINEPSNENSEGKKEEFTVLIELSEKDQEEYQDAINKGYVDGYHKACDSIHCPRSSVY